MLTVISRVCAEFYNGGEEPIFAVKPNDIGRILEAPDEIKNDLLFNMLLKDGSIEAVVSLAQKKALENDPMNGTTADGKNETAAYRSSRKSKAAEAKKEAETEKDPEDK